MTRILLLTVLLLGNTATAQTIERGPTPRLCDHYGDPLPEGAIRRFGTVRFFHPLMEDFVLVDQERTLVTVGQDGSAKWWDVATGKLRYSVQLGDFRPCGMLLSEDARTIVTIHGSLKVTIWDARTLPPKPRQTIEAKQDESLWPRALSPDGSTLIMQPDGKRLRLVNTATGKGREVTFDDEPGDPDIIPRPPTAFSGNGQAFVHFRYGVKKPLTVHDTATGKILFALVDPPNVAVLSKAGTVLLTGSMLARKEEKFVRLSCYDIAKQKLVEEHDVALTFLCGQPRLEPDDRYLALGGEPENVLFDLGTGRVVAKFPYRAMKTTFSSIEGRRLFVADGSQVHLWDWVAKRAIQPRPMLGYSWDEHQHLLANYDDTGRVVHVWDRRHGQVVHEVPLQDYPDALRLHADRLQVFVGAKTVETYALKTGRRLTSVALAEATPCGPEWSANAYFSRDGQRLFLRQSLFTDKVMQVREFLWDTTTGQRLRPNRGAPERDLDDYLEGQHRMQVLQDNAAVTVKDVASGLVVLKIPCEQTHWCLSPDGTLLALWTESPVDKKPRYTITVWDVLTGKQRWTAPTKNRHYNNLWFDPKAHTLLAMVDGELVALELTTGQVRAQMPLQIPFDILPSGKPYFADGQFLFMEGGFPALLYDIRRLLPPSAKTQALTAKERLAHWANLASDDPVIANASTWALQRDDAKEVLVFLKQQLTTPAPTTANVQQLIGDLNDARFAKREAASKQLAALGRPIAMLLRDAEKKTDSAEVRERLGKLLNTLGQAPGTPEQRQAYRAVAVLERLASPEAVALLKSFAAGSELAHVTHAAKAALARLASAK